MAKYWLHTLLLLASALGAHAQALQDPTRPTDPALYFGGHRTEGTSAWTLQSILSSADIRIAVINDTCVREGDRIGDARVISIQPSHVVLNTGNRTMTLKLGNKKIKKVSP
jgi:MSHA biogenesis protein MshK